MSIQGYGTRMPEVAQTRLAPIRDEFFCNPDTGMELSVSEYPEYADMPIIMQTSHDAVGLVIWWTADTRAEADEFIDALLDETGE